MFRLRNKKNNFLIRLKIMSAVCLVVEPKIYIKGSNLQVFCFSHDVASGSDITPCIKIDKPLDFVL